MIYEAHKPRCPLDEFIETIIYYDGVAHDHLIDRFLPNGDVEILIDFNDGPQFIYDNETLKEIQACNHVWASGLRTEPITIPSGTGACMMVIAFKKGRAAPFFPFPMSEIRDSVVDADLIWGSEFGDLRERLLAEKDSGQRFGIVEDFLIGAFGRKLGLDPCIAYALTEMTERPDRLNIATMNSQIGYSQKHFGEMFRRQTGVTPKAFLRIMRFQKAIRYIDAAEQIDWAAIAQECGFYDQSHFISDFKHFSGFTPEQYSKIHSNYQNYMPVG